MVNVLWYGFIYYLTATFFVVLAVFALFRLAYLHTLNRLEIATLVLQYCASFYTFFLTISLLTLYHLLDFFTTFTVLYHTLSEGIFLCDFLCLDSTLSASALDLNLLTIYTFPFLYIFLLITILSILSCLAYNVNEVVTFIFYCTAILMSGYLLFFTDSIILFFLAYELLLIPSFLLLYNFAKTRRCVEAAYLMFFWTQFGAMFLMCSFIFLFFLCGTSSFSVVGTFYFSSFETTFLFIC
jgi:hypothetical protein